MADEKWRGGLRTADHVSVLQRYEVVDGRHRVPYQRPRLRYARTNKRAMDTLSNMGYQTPAIPFIVCSNLLDSAIWPRATACRSNGTSVLREMSRTQRLGSADRRGTGLRLNARTRPFRSSGASFFLSLSRSAISRLPDGTARSIRYQGKCRIIYLSSIQHTSFDLKESYRMLVV